MEVSEFRKLPAVQEHRIGQFVLCEKHANCWSRVYAACQCIMKAENDYTFLTSIRVTAFSMEFDPVPAGQQPPQYGWYLDTENVLRCQRLVTTTVEPQHENVEGFRYLWQM